MNVFTLGLRGIGRNRRRTLVTVSAMAFAGTMTVIYSALFEGFFYTLERNAVGMELGDVQVHAEGYRRDPDLYKRIEDHRRITDALTDAGFRTTTRLFGYGLAAADESSAGVTIRGVEPESEGLVTLLPSNLAAGDWLRRGDADGVVLGRKLARALRAEIGDEVVVVGQAADGSMANDLFYVRGILKAVGDVLDRSGFVVTQTAFRRLFVVPDGVHQIVVARPVKQMALDVAAERVKTVAEGHDTASWRELQPVLARSLETSMASQVFLMIVMYAAIAMLVLNATLMSVFERIREFGIMKALGVKPAQVLAVVLIEVVAQSLLAALVAAAVGIPVAVYMQTHGVDLSFFADATSVMGVAFDPTWYALVTPSSVVVPLLALVVIAVLAAVYPGLKAAWIRPLAAIRYT